MAPFAPAGPVEPEQPASQQMPAATAAVIVPEGTWWKRSFRLDMVSPGGHDICGPRRHRLHVRGFCDRCLLAGLRYSESVMNLDADLVTRARSGDRPALDQLVRESTDLVFNLAVRMLGDRADAEDATQEILVRVVYGLESFRGESSFRTWIYRVASNYLLTARKRLAEQKMGSFDKLETFL